MPLVEQELPTFPEHTSSPPDYCGIRVAQSLVFSVVYCISLFVLLSFFHFATVLSVLPRVTAPDCPLVTFLTQYKNYVKEHK